MGALLDWFFAFLTTMIDGIWMIVTGLFNGVVQIFNIVDYIKQFNSYKEGFSVMDWILAIVAFILVVLIWIIIVFLIVLFVRKYIRYRKSAVGSEDLLEEVADLHRDVIRLTKEKERILALKIGDTNIPVDLLNDVYADGGEESEEEKTTEEIGDLPPRFSKLDAIDQKYLYYTAPEYRRD